MCSKSLFYLVIVIKNDISIFKKRQLHGSQLDLKEHVNVFHSMVYQDKIQGN